MLPKSFFENHFTGEIRDELFVALASDEINLYSKKLSVLKKAADCLEPKLQVVSIQRDSKIDDITYKIFDRISHSKMLLFDLSDDERVTLAPKDKPQTKEINANVVYELGVALTFRDKSGITLIRKKSKRSLENLPFDIKGLNIIQYENEEEIKEIVLKQADEKLERKKKLIEGIAHCIDEIAYYFITRDVLKRHEKERHFNIQWETKFLLEIGFKISEEQVRLSVFRLMDLGLLKIEAYDERPGEGAAYHWTDLGKEILNFIEKNKGNQTVG